MDRTAVILEVSATQQQAWNQHAAFNAFYALLLLLWLMFSSGREALRQMSVLHARTGACSAVY